MRDFAYWLVSQWEWRRWSWLPRPPSIIRLWWGAEWLIRYLDETNRVPSEEVFRVARRG